MNILLAPRQRPCYDETSLKCYEARHMECGNDICRTVVASAPYLLIILILLMIMLIISANKEL